MTTFIAWKVPRREIRWHQVRDVLRHAAQGWCRGLIVGLSLAVLFACLVEVIQPGIGVPWLGWKSGLGVLGVSLLFFGIWLSTLWPFGFKVELRDAGLYARGRLRMKWSEIEGFALTTLEDKKQCLLIKRGKWILLDAPAERLAEIVVFLSSRCAQLLPPLTPSSGTDFILTPRYVITGLLLSILNALWGSFTLASLSNQLGRDAIFWGLLFICPLTGVICGTQFKRSFPNNSEVGNGLTAFFGLMTFLFIALLYKPLMLRLSVLP